MKPTLTKPQAESLKRALDLYEEERIIKYHIVQSASWRNHFSAFNTLSLRDLALALYVGYDVEKTPEERILADYEWCRRLGAPHALGRMSGIKFTLDELGVKIAGINAPSEEVSAE